MCYINGFMGSRLSHIESYRGGFHETFACCIILGFEDGLSSPQQAIGDVFRDFDASTFASKSGYLYFGW